MKSFKQGDPVVVVKYTNMADPDAIEIVDLTNVTIVTNEKVYIRQQVFAFTPDGNPLFSKQVMGNVFLRHYDDDFKLMISKTKQLKKMKKTLKNVGNLLKETKGEGVLKVYSMLPKALKDLVEQDD